MNEKTDAVVGALGDKALQYLNGLEALTKQYAPDVADAALSVVRISALNNLFWGAIGLVGLVFVAWKLAPWYFRLITKDYRTYDEPVGLFIFGGMGLLVSALSCLGMAANILTIWTWIALFNPKLYIAYKVFEKIL